MFERRCEWRGIGFELAGAGIGDAVDPDAHDLFYLGGGQDRDQALCARDLATVKRDALHAAADRGAVVFAVCGGYQLLGHAYELGDEQLPGVGLVDLDTVREDGPRLIGNVAIEVELPGGPRDARGLREPRRAAPTSAPARAPLGRVLEGHGNNGARRRRGRPRRAARTVIGTYMHGPLLPEERLVRRLADRARRSGSRRRAAAARRRAGGRGARRGGAGRRRLRPEATPQKRIAATAMPWAQATSSATGTCSSAVCARAMSPGPKLTAGIPASTTSVAASLQFSMPPSRAGRPRSRSRAEQLLHDRLVGARSPRAGRRRAATRPRAGAPAATGRRPRPARASPRPPLGLPPPRRPLGRYSMWTSIRQRAG